MRMRHGSSPSRRLWYQPMPWPCAWPRQRGFLAAWSIRPSFLGTAPAGWRSTASHSSRRGDGCFCTRATRLRKPAQRSNVWASHRPRCFPLNLQQEQLCPVPAPWHSAGSAG